MTISEFFSAIAKRIFPLDCERQMASCYLALPRGVTLHSAEVDGANVTSVGDVGLRPLDTIHVHARICGGGLVDLDTLWELVAFELESRLDDLPFAMLPTEMCIICNADDIPLLSVCHYHFCRECLLAQMKINNFKLRCQCNSEKGIEELIHSLKSIVDSLRETQALLRNVDVQICRCGTMLSNETLEPHALCPRCSFQMCFFCKRDWDPKAGMSNKAHYRCCEGCVFGERFRYELVRFEYGTDPTWKIPNRRMCPECYEVGGYDSKCKYHRCNCGHAFCFMCLKPQAECQKTSTYNKLCTVATQGPHLMKHLIATPKPPN
jgi:hypothetical protein